MRRVCRDKKAPGRDNNPREARDTHSPIDTSLVTFAICITIIITIVVQQINIILYIILIIMIRISAMLVMFAISIIIH